MVAVEILERVAIASAVMDIENNAPAAIYRQPHHAAHGYRVKGEFHFAAKRAKS